MKYQTKPIEVDAVQWFKNGDDERVMADNTIFIEPKGWRYIKPSDWIITYKNNKEEVYSNTEFRKYFEKQEEKPF